MIAALYVRKRGCYWDLPGVDPWDEERDAMLYDGPHPVVAHPPCTRWCRLAEFVESRYPQYKVAEDGGTFESALAAVRKYGGVLEHPAWSKAWAEYYVPKPHTKGGWQRGFCGGWVCHVEQGQYGHRAKKATWLYAYGVKDLPELRWGSTPDSKVTALVSWCGNKIGSGEKRPRLSKKASIATPVEFRDLLLDIARSAA